MVVWFHAPSKLWRVLEDRCPHRLAPLSEGRIEGGCLQCSYHGWTFDAAGQCTGIPQADSAQQERAACGSARSRVAAFPTRQEQGMLWVWPDSGVGVRAASARHPLPLPSELVRAAPGDEPHGALLGDWYMRDLPVSAEHLLENLVDPSHVHFAHHGLIGSRDRRGSAIHKAGSISLEQQGALTAQGGFRLCMRRHWLGGRGSEHDISADVPGYVGSAAGGGAGSAASAPSVTHFLPPGLVWLEMPAGTGPSSFSMLFYAVPVSPGASRIIAGYSSDAIPPALKHALQSDLLQPLLHAFTFLADLGAHEIIDGDLIHIFEQASTVAGQSGQHSAGPSERAVRGGPGGRPDYFMPAAADSRRLIAWGTRPSVAPCMQAPHPATAAYRQLRRRDILDRYEQHTRTCPSCRRAFAAVKTARAVLRAAAVSGGSAAIAASVVAALLPAPTLAPPPWLGVGRASLPLVLGTSALLGAALDQALERLEQRFVYINYEHHSR
eukprot:scaffold24.g2979.t1